jgi:hypothetical protein
MGTIHARAMSSRTALLVMCVATAVSSNCEAQTNNPVVKVHAFEREVVGGIPGGPPGVGAQARQMRYIIYLETPPKTDVAVDGVWMKSRFHSADTEIKKAPVRFESPVKLADDTKNVAVPPTTNTVTEITVKEPVPDRTPDANASKLLGENAAVVQLSYSGKTVFVPVKRFERREPLYMR